MVITKIVGQEWRNYYLKQNRDGFEWNDHEKNLNIINHLLLPNRIPLTQLGPMLLIHPKGLEKPMSAMRG